MAGAWGEGGGGGEVGSCVGAGLTSCVVDMTQQHLEDAPVFSVSLTVPLPHRGNYNPHILRDTSFQY